MGSWGGLKVRSYYNNYLKVNMTAWHWMACLVFILPPLLAPLGISLQIGMAQCLLSSAGIIAVYTYLSVEFGEGNGTRLQYSCLKNPMGLVGCSPWGRWVGYNWAASLSLFTFMHWRRQWQPTPVFLPGESQGRGSLMGCCLWGRTVSDMTEVT